MAEAWASGQTPGRVVTNVACPLPATRRHLPQRNLLFPGTSSPRTARSWAGPQGNHGQGSCSILALQRAMPASCVCSHPVAQDVPARTRTARARDIHAHTHDAHAVATSIQGMGTPVHAHAANTRGPRPHTQAQAHPSAPTSSASPAQTRPAAPRGRAHAPRAPPALSLGRQQPPPGGPPGAAPRCA